jgi:hypothetical protein
MELISRPLVYITDLLFKHDRNLYQVHEERCIGLHNWEMLVENLGRDETNGSNESSFFFHLAAFLPSVA